MRDDDYDKVKILDCKGIAVNKSGKMLLCECSDWDEPRWIVKSLIDDDSEVYAKDTEGVLILPRWYVNKEGLL